MGAEGAVGATVGFGATFNATLPATERDAAAGRAAHKPQ